MSSSDTAAIATCLAFASQVLQPELSPSQAFHKETLGPMVLEAHRFGSKLPKELDFNDAEPRTLLQKLQSHSGCSIGSSRIDLGTVQVADISWDFAGEVSQTLEIELVDVIQRVGTSNRCLLFEASGTVTNHAIIWLPPGSTKFLLYICPGKIKVVKGMKELLKKMLEEMNIQDQSYRVWALLGKEKDSEQEKVIEGPEEALDMIIRRPTSSSSSSSSVLRRSKSGKEPDKRAEASIVVEVGSNSMEKVKPFRVFALKQQETYSRERNIFAFPLEKQLSHQTPPPVQVEEAEETYEVPSLRISSSSFRVTRSDDVRNSKTGSVRASSTRITTTAEDSIPSEPFKSTEEEPKTKIRVKITRAPPESRLVDETNIFTFDRCLQPREKQQAPCKDVDYPHQILQESIKSLSEPQQESFETFEIRKSIERKSADVKNSSLLFADESTNHLESEGIRKSTHNMKEYTQASMKLQESINESPSFEDSSLLRKSTNVRESKGFATSVKIQPQASAAELLSSRPSTAKLRPTTAQSIIEKCTMLQQEVTGQSEEEDDSEDNLCQFLVQKPISRAERRYKSKLGERAWWELNYQAQLLQKEAAIAKSAAATITISSKRKSSRKTTEQEDEEQDQKLLNRSAKSHPQLSDPIDVQLDRLNTPISVHKVSYNSALVDRPHFHEDEEEDEKEEDTEDKTVVSVVVDTPPKNLHQSPSVWGQEDNTVKKTVVVPPIQMGIGSKWAKHEQLHVFPTHQSTTETLEVQGNNMEGDVEKDDEDKEDFVQYHGIPFNQSGRVPIIKRRPSAKPRVESEDEGEEEATQRDSYKRQSFKTSSFKVSHSKPGHTSKASSNNRDEVHQRKIASVVQALEELTAEDNKKNLPVGQKATAAFVVLADTSKEDTRTEKLFELRQKKLAQMQKAREEATQKKKQQQQQLITTTTTKGLTPRTVIHEAIPKSAPLSSTLLSTNEMSTMNGGRAVKKPSNRKLIQNAIEFNVLAGGSVEKERLVALQAMNQSTCEIFIILFKSAKEMKFRGLYEYHIDKDEVRKIYGGPSAPSTLVHTQIGQFFKYNSGKKDFSPVETRSFTVKTDAVALADHLVFKKRNTTALAKIL